MGGSDDLACGGCCLFKGFSGQAVVVTLTAGAFCFYVGSFAYRRAAGRDTRTWKVFWLDLLKMGLGQICAFGVNVLNSHRNARTAGAGLDPLSWYFPTFLNDEIIAVPLGVGLWHAFLFCVRRVHDRCPSFHSLAALRNSGRYYPLPEKSADRPLIRPATPACGPLGALARAGGRAAESCCACAREDPEVRYDWWAIQLVCWVGAVLLSRGLGGLVVPTVARLLGDASPYYRMASWIHGLQWSCNVKRWTFAGVFRIMIDVLQLAFVDMFNKFRHKMGAPGRIHDEDDPVPVQ